MKNKTVVTTDKSQQADNSTKSAQYENSSIINQISPINSSNTLTVRNYILKVLKACSSVNTLEFRKLGVFAPAPRIFELGHQFAYEIDTVFEKVTDDAGVKHAKVARYVLKKQS